MEGWSLQLLTVAFFSSVSLEHLTLLGNRKTCIWKVQLVKLCLSIMGRFLVKQIVVGYVIWRSLTPQSIQYIKQLCIFSNTFKLTDIAWHLMTLCLAWRQNGIATLSRNIPAIKQSIVLLTCRNIRPISWTKAGIFTTLNNADQNLFPFKVWVELDERWKLTICMWKWFSHSQIIDSGRCESRMVTGRGVNHSLIANNLHLTLQSTKYFHVGKTWKMKFKISSV